MWLGVEGQFSVRRVFGSQFCFAHRSLPLFLPNFELDRAGFMPAPMLVGRGRLSLGSWRFLSTHPAGRDVAKEMIARETGREAANEPRDQASRCYLAQFEGARTSDRGFTGTNAKWATKRKGCSRNPQPSKVNHRRTASGRSRHSRGDA